MKMKWGKKPEDQMVPFDKDGHQLTYADPYGYSSSWNPVTWKPNEVFADTLRYVSYSRGRSSAMFEFERASTRTAVHMFMTDIDDIMPKIVSGQLSGMFTFSKRGQNYGVKMVSDTKVV